MSIQQVSGDTAMSDTSIPASERAEHWLDEIRYALISGFEGHLQVLPPPTKNDLAKWLGDEFSRLYGIDRHRVHATVEDDMRTGHITFQPPMPLNYVRIELTSPLDQGETMDFEINPDGWTDAPAGTVRAVPTAPSTVKLEVFDGEEWRQAGSSLTLFSAGVSVNTAPQGSSA